MDLEFVSSRDTVGLAIGANHYMHHTSAGTLRTAGSGKFSRYRSTMMIGLTEDGKVGQFIIPPSSSPCAQAKHFKLSSQLHKFMYSCCVTTVGEMDQSLSDCVPPFHAEPNIEGHSRMPAIYSEPL